MAIKQDLIIAALSTGIGVFIGLGVAAHQDSKLILPRLVRQPSFVCTFQNATTITLEAPHDDVTF